MNSNLKKMKINRRKKRTIEVIFIIIIVLLIFVALFKMFMNLENNKGSSLEEYNPMGKTLEYKGTTYRYNSKIKSYLVLGLDDFYDGNESLSYQNTKCADFILVLAMDKNNKSIKVLQIDRDTIVPIRKLDIHGNTIGYSDSQIALSHTYGSGKEDSIRNTLYSVRKLLFGLNVTDSISFTMDAVKEINDYVGGVYIDDLDKVLIGDEALYYVRARKDVDDGTNVARMVRQRKYLESLKAIAKEKITNISEDEISKLTEYMSTTLSVNSLNELSNMLISYDLEYIKLPEGEIDYSKEFVEFYPNEDSLKEILIDMFYKEK